MPDRFRRMARAGSLALALAAASAVPVPAEPEATLVALGRSSFRAYCATCHGPEGRGDGPVAEYLRVPPADLTGIRARHEGKFPRERVFAIIDGREPVRGHGSSEMPAWGEAFRKTGDEVDEEAVRAKIEALVHFIESLQEP